MNWTIAGVEYIDGTFGPRCVMPISDVVTIVISSDNPGANSLFIPELLLIPGAVHTGHRCYTPIGDLCLESASYRSTLRSMPTKVRPSWAPLRAPDIIGQRRAAAR